MKEKIKKLLIDCANFIQPYGDGGNEAERLMVRLDEIIAEDLHETIVNLDIPKGVCVSDQTYNNVVKTFHS